MGKPRKIESKPRKDGFFIGNRRERRQNNRNVFGESSSVDTPYSKHSDANSGGFFITPLTKQIPKTDTKIEEDKSHDTPKKVFDKKKWRLQKYSKKYKLEQWEEKRKKTVLHEYYKQLNDDEPKFDVKKIYEKYDDDEDAQEATENENNLNRNIVQEQSSNVVDDAPKVSKKKKAYKKAHLEYQRIQEEKKNMKAEFEKKKSERAQAVKEYKQKKLEKYKNLNKKTKKGQPIMKYRMEMLLEQIEKSVQ